MCGGIAAGGETPSLVMSLARPVEVETVGISACLAK